MMSDAATVVDLAFPVHGDAIPIDHGYVLFASLSRQLDGSHLPAGWGVHPVRGIRSGRAMLGLDRSSRIKVRMPAAEIVTALPLTGATLDVDGHSVSLGPPRVLPLEPAAVLVARFVTIKGFADAPAAFTAAVHRQLARMEGIDQPVDGITVVVGRRRTIRVAAHVIVGFAVGLEGLTARSSLAVQRVGLGGRRHMGAGLFVPRGKAVHVQVTEPHAQGGT